MGPGHLLEVDVYGMLAQSLSDVRQVTLLLVGLGLARYIHEFPEQRRFDLIEEFVEGKLAEIYVFVYFGGVILLPSINGIDA